MISSNYNRYAADVRAGVCKTQTAWYFTFPSAMAASSRVANLVSELRNVCANGERDAPIVVDGVEEDTRGHGTGMWLCEL